jgi:hypothetical protein
MIQSGPLFHKPQSFISAKNLLYTSICVGIFIILLHRLIPGTLGNGVITSIILISAEYIFMFFAAKQMALCKKWARTTLLFVFISLLATYLYMFKIESKVSMAEVALFILQTALQFLAIIFLYLKETNIWFNSRTSSALP